MKKLIYSLFLGCSLILVSSCELDLLDSPNAVSLSQADPNFLLNRIQIDLAGFFDAAGDGGQRLTRMINQDENTYETAYQPVSHDGIWNTGYANILQDIKTLRPLAEASNFKRHEGMAKVMEAYVWLTLVDLFGDIPYSEAFNPSNFNPVADGGAAVYAAAVELLNDAKTDLTDATSIGTPTDLYYTNNYGRWVKLANTLLLKAYLNTGNVAAINALIVENNLIGVGDEFIFRYGTTLNDPFSRHPSYQPNGGGDYQSNFYMWHLTEAKGFDDPRARFYFYRPVGTNPTDVNNIRCINEFTPAHYVALNMVFCLPGTRGYWGRDHLDNQGIPPDNLIRTLFGVYPAGGIFDNSSFGPPGATKQGAIGAGLQPIMTAAFVDFMLSEAAQRLSTSGDAKALLLSGIRKSMDFVRAFSVSTNQAAVINAFQTAAAYTTAVDAYVAYVDSEYDAATDRLNVIAREYWLSLFGNGVEAYNLYRRTGRPTPMQPGLIPNFGTFPKSYLYPSNYANRNNKATQKNVAGNGVVFWDTFNHSIN